MNEEYVESLTKGIDNDNPAGIQLDSNDSDFPQVLMAVESAADLAHDVNWAMIVEACEMLLREKSKDMWVVTYLCRGKFQIGGYSALSDALGVCHRLLDDFSDSIYPQENDSRIDALKWLSRSAKEIVGALLEPADKDDAAACLESINQISKLVEEQFDQQNVLAELGGKIDRARSRLLYVSSLTLPFDGHDPAGVNLDSDDDFSQVLLEVRKTSNPLNVVDWPMIVKNCEMLLDEKSKDLRVGAYLCRGKFQEGGYSEFGDALAVCSTLLNDFGTSIYPKDKGYRTNALKSLSDRMQEALDSSLEPNDKDAAEACVQLINRINTLIKEELGLRDNLGVLENKINAALEGLSSTEETSAENPQPFGSAQSAQSGKMKVETGKPGGESQVALTYLERIDEANRLFDSQQKQEPLDLLVKGIEQASDTREAWILKFNFAKLCAKSDRLLLASTLLTMLKSQITPHGKGWDENLYSDFLLVEFDLNLRVNDAEFNAVKAKYQSHYTEICELSLAKALARDREILELEQSGTS